MKNKENDKKVDEIINGINITSSIVTLSDTSSATLDFSSVKHPELLEPYEKISLEEIKKKSLKKKG